MDVLLILGPTGSGKSLLCRALQLFPGTAILDEFALPPILAHIGAQQLEPDMHSGLVKGIRAHVQSTVYCGAMNSRLSSLVGFIRGRLAWPDLREHLRTGRKPSKLLVIESNFFSLAPNLLLETFPDAKMIVMIRDARDCADRWDFFYNPFDEEREQQQSLNETPLGRRIKDIWIPWWVHDGEEDRFLASSPYGKCVWLWREMARRCIALSEEHCDRVLVVRFEDLVNEPTTIIERVAAHIGKSPSSAILKQLGRIKKDDVGRFRRRSPTELAEAESLAAMELQYFKYIQLDFAN